MKALLIPKRSEWRTYTADQKRGVVIYLITLTAALCSLTLWLYLQASEKLLNLEREKLTGIWHSEYSWNSPSGKIEVIGTTHNLANGNYNFSGELSMSIDRPSRINIAWHISATGKWALEEDQLVTQLIDLKSSIKRASIEGLDPNNQSTIAHLSNIKLESLFPKKLT